MEYTIIIVLLLLIILSSVTTVDKQKEYYTGYVEGELNTDPSNVTIKSGFLEFVRGLMKTPLSEPYKKQREDTHKSTLKNLTEILKNSNNSDRHLYTKVNTVNQKYEQSKRQIANYDTTSRAIQH